jgi:hypothetical protein
MLPHFLVTVWRWDGSVNVRTFASQGAAFEWYEGLVNPKKPHTPDTLNSLVIMSQSMREYRSKHNPRKTVLVEKRGNFGGKKTLSVRKKQ